MSSMTSYKASGESGINYFCLLLYFCLYLSQYMYIVKGLGTDQVEALLYSADFAGALV